MYLVILNRPRDIRLKCESVILVGIIPGPCEPSLTVNTYLSPIGQPGTDATNTSRCALLAVACDLPAARKVCGFLSYSANLGCSGCFQGFSEGFGRRNFDREH